MGNEEGNKRKLTGDENTPETCFATRPSAMRNWYGRKDMVPSELPDSPTTICLLRREEEKYCSGAVGSTAESLHGGLSKVKGEEGTPAQGPALAKWAGPWFWMATLCLLSGSCSAAALGWRSEYMGLNPDSGVNSLSEASKPPSSLGVAFLCSHNPVLCLFYANHCAWRGSCSRELRGIPALTNWESRLGRWQTRGISGGSHAYPPDKEEISRGETILKEDIPESKKRTKVGAIKQLSLHGNCRLCESREWWEMGLIWG